MLTKLLPNLKLVQSMNPILKSNFLVEIGCSFLKKFI